MANEYFTPSGAPGTRTTGSSSVMRAEFNRIEAMGDKLPVLAGNGGFVVLVKEDETGLESGPFGNAIYTAAYAGAVSRTFQVKFDEIRSIKDFGAVGDGNSHPLSSVYSTLAAAQAKYPFVTSLSQELDFAAAVSFFAAGGGHLLAGRYKVTPFAINNFVKAICEPGVVFEWAEVPATTSRVDLIKITTGAEYSVFGDFTVDGNVALLGPAHVYTTLMDEWFGLVIECANVTIGDVMLHGMAGLPGYLTGNYLKTGVITCDDCMGAVQVGYYRTPPNADSYGKGMKIGGITGQNFVLRGLSLFAQIANVQNLDNTSIVGPVNILYQNADSANRSPFIVGMVAVGCNGTKFLGGVAISPVTETHTHLAYSFVSCINCDMRNFNCFDIASLALEVIGGGGCSYSDCIFDGYHRTTSVNQFINSSNQNGNSFGVSLNYVGKYIDQVRDETSAMQGHTFNNVVSRGFALGLWCRAPNALFTACDFSANQRAAVLVQSWLANAEWTQQKIENQGVIFQGCIGDYNGSNGILAQDYKNLRIDGGRYNGNGQTNETYTYTDPERACAIADTVPALSAGFLTVTNIEATDQTFTVAAGNPLKLTYRPGSSDDDDSPQEAVLTRLSDSKVRPGMRLLLKAYDSGADAIAYVIAVEQDEIRVHFTQVRVDGTWSCTPVSTTITGVGGDALSTVTAGDWIAFGSKIWREVTSVFSNNQIIVSAPFPFTAGGKFLRRVVPRVASTTHNKVALTGTVTSSGTTITGTGTAFDTEIIGPVYIVTSTGQQLQVISVTNATSMRLAVAPSPALAGATLSYYVINAEYTVRQQRGILIGDNIAKWYTRGNRLGGNGQGRMSLNAAALSAAMEGSEYYRVANITLSAATEQQALSGIPAGHRVTGVAAQVTTAIVGPATWGLNVYNFTGTTSLGTITTGNSGAVNTAYYGDTPDARLTSASNGISITTPSNPSAGVLKVEGAFRFQKLESF